MISLAELTKDGPAAGEMSDMTEEEKLRSNAALAVKTLGPHSDVAAFGFDRESVAWVEGYIERQRIRPDMTDETKNGLISVLGSFLGECIIHLHGGQWRRDEIGWGVHFDGGNVAYPFSKVQKLMTNGLEGGGSIVSFLDTTGVLFKRKRPWWKFW